MDIFLCIVWINPPFECLFNVMGSVSRVIAVPVMLCQLLLCQFCPPSPSGLNTLPDCPLWCHHAEPHCEWKQATISKANSRRKLQPRLTQETVEGKKGLVHPALPLYSGQSLQISRALCICCLTYLHLVLLYLVRIHCPFSIAWFHQDVPFQNNEETMSHPPQYSLSCTWFSPSDWTSHSKNYLFLKVPRCSLLLQ